MLEFLVNLMWSYLDWIFDVLCFPPVNNVGIAFQSPDVIHERSADVSWKIKPETLLDLASSPGHSQFLMFHVPGHSQF